MPVLKLCRQQYYRWCTEPVTQTEWDHAHRANALFDAHREDPEFGYRYLHEEPLTRGAAMSARTAWKLCSANEVWLSDITEHWMA